MLEFETSAPKDAEKLFADRCMLKRGEMLFIKDKPNNEFYFLLSGLARSFNFNDEGKVFTHNFFFPCVFVDNYATMKPGTPANINIQMLKTGEAIVINRELLYSMANKYPLLWKIQAMIIQAQGNWKSKHDRKFETMSKNERYEDLCTNYPHYIQQIPQKLLASYLKMHEVTLSLVRKGE
jgi:CRP-like cAMP-binding protein